MHQSARLENQERGDDPAEKHVHQREHHVAAERRKLRDDGGTEVTSFPYRLMMNTPRSGRR